MEFLMPLLLLSPRYTMDSRILRKVARGLGWETFRLDGDSIPEWIEEFANDEVAIYITYPLAFQVATRLSHRLLGPTAQILCQLPNKYLKRDICLSTLEKAISDFKEISFVKSAIGKKFPARIYKSSLELSSFDLPNHLSIYISEPVTWLVEYRFFILERKVMTMRQDFQFNSLTAFFTIFLFIP